MNGHTAVTVGDAVLLADPIAVSPDGGTDQRGLCKLLLLLLLWLLLPIALETRCISKAKSPCIA